MMETTYTLKLGQLLKITLNLKKYVAKIKPKWPNLVTKVILKPNVAIVIKTHYEVDIAFIEVDN